MRTGEGGGVVWPKFVRTEYFRIWCWSSYSENFYLHWCHPQGGVMWPNIFRAQKPMTIVMQQQAKQQICLHRGVSVAIIGEEALRIRHTHHRTPPYRLHWAIDFCRAAAFKNSEPEKMKLLTLTACLGTTKTYQILKLFTRILSKLALFVTSYSSNKAGNESDHQWLCYRFVFVSLFTAQ